MYNGATQDHRKKVWFSSRVSHTFRKS